MKNQGIILLTAVLFFGFISIPSAVGAIWFQNITDSDFYSESGTMDCSGFWADDGWNLTLTSPSKLTVTATDQYCRGDYFSIYVNGSVIGTTPNPGSWLCPGDRFSSGSFQINLPAGTHQIKVHDDALPYTYNGMDMCPAGFSISGELGDRLVANCSASPESAGFGQTVTFTASASGGTGSYTYSWFGDCIGSQSTCSQSYTTEGVKTAYLTVYSGGQSASASCFARVDASPLIVSCSGAPDPANLGQDVTFTASASGGTGYYSYSWSNDCSGSAASCTTSFSTIGQKTARVTVTSGSQTNSADCSIHISQCETDDDCKTLYSEAQRKPRCDNKTLKKPYSQCVNGQCVDVDRDCGNDETPDPNLPGNRMCENGRWIGMASWGMEPGSRGYVNWFQSLSNTQSPCGSIPGGLGIGCSESTGAIPYIDQKKIKRGCNNGICVVKPGGMVVISHDPLVTQYVEKECSYRTFNGVACRNAVPDDGCGATPCFCEATCYENKVWEKEQDCLDAGAIRWVADTEKCAINTAALATNLCGVQLDQNGNGVAVSNTLSGGTYSNVSIGWCGITRKAQCKICKAAGGSASCEFVDKGDYTVTSKLCGYLSLLGIRTCGCFPANYPGNGHFKFGLCGRIDSYWECYSCVGAACIHAFFERNDYPGFMCGGGGGGGGGGNPHTECNDSNQCVAVATAGVNACATDADCAPEKTYNACDANQECVQKTGNAPNQCLISDDCTQHYNICDNVNQTCIQVVGNLNNQCQTNADCVPKTHKECNTQQQCVEVAGQAADQCQATADCISHKECNFVTQQCITSQTPGTNECTIYDDCLGNPYATDLFTPPENGCLPDTPGCGALSFQWIYQSPFPITKSKKWYDFGFIESVFAAQAVNQKGWDLQVDDNADFSSPEMNISVRDLNNPPGTQNSQATLVKSIPTTPGCGYLSYGQQYFWRVRVWDLNNRNSGWIVYKLAGIPAPVITNDHAAPTIRFAPNFTSIEAGEAIVFIDSSLCYDNNQNSYLCKTNPATTYTWTFGDGIVGNDHGNTSHVYNDVGTYNAVLRICDELGICCEDDIDIQVGTAGTDGGDTNPPEWQEISPF